MINETGMRHRFGSSMLDELLGIGVRNGIFKERNLSDIMDRRNRVEFFDTKPHFVNVCPTVLWKDFDLDWKKEFYG